LVVRKSGGIVFRGLVIAASVVSLATVLLVSSARADQAVGTSPLERTASVMELGTLYLSGQLFQMAYSEHDALKTREQGTRFIPHQIASYYLPEPSGKNIHIVATYRSADPSLSKQGAQKICESMIRWVRFHLGIKDDGSPIGHASKYGSSTLFQFITSSDVDLDVYEKDWALALDKQTIVIGNVAAVGQTSSSPAMCKMPLTEPER
jgi:hypothetical protein